MHLTTSGKEIELDSRTSDAVAIAIRFKAPIFTYEAIISESGIILDKDVISSDTVQKKKKPKQKAQMTLRVYLKSELEKKLNEAIDKRRL